jgi:hypothetical protein
MHGLEEVRLARSVRTGDEDETWGEVELLAGVRPKVDETEVRNDQSVRSAASRPAGWA